MSNRKGFLLLEVVISVAIIASCLVLVTRVYSTAKYTIQRSFVLFRSGLLLESKMFEFEENGKIERDFVDQGEFPDDKAYSWVINSTRLPDDAVFGQQLDLNLVNLEVSRRDDRGAKSYVTRYSIATYLNNK